MKVDLGVTLWDGMYEGMHARWLRWCDHKGNLILTGAEHADQEKLRADQEKLRADQEKLRAENKAREVAEILLAMGDSVEKIKKATGLTTGEIRQLGQESVTLQS